MQMRDGSKFEGRIEELTANGELFVRVSQHDQRRVPVTSVALIDKVGGASGLPDTEIREAAGSQHLLLLTNGSSVKGQLVAIRGGEGSANDEHAAHVCVPRADGREQTLRAGAGVARLSRERIRLPRAPAPRRQPERPGRPASIRRSGSRAARPVAGCRPGCACARASAISFNTHAAKCSCRTTATIARARPGTPRMAPGAPLPTVNAGALIGRVGNSQPFGIGDQAAVPMPFDGVLYLAVNDDERSDNAGEFIVSMIDAAARRYSPLSVGPSRGRSSADPGCRPP